MLRRLGSYLTRISLAYQFMLVSLVILIIGLIGLGWWVGKQIQAGVIDRVASEKALYVDSFIDPPLYDFTTGTSLDPISIQTLNDLVQHTPLGQNIVDLKIWDLQGRVIYSTSPSLIGKVFPIKPELTRAMHGDVVSVISNLSDPENFLEHSRWNQLLETYSPVTKSGTSQIVAVVEFYQTMDALQADIQRAQQSSWLVLGLATMVVYLILSVFVKRASDTIEQQREQLKGQVIKLTELLSQNDELHERVKRASFRSTELNERVLRRISAELHDGPAQDLGYALLSLDGIIKRIEDCLGNTFTENPCTRGIKEIEISLQHAMGEIRAISAGMGLPELDHLSIKQTLERVVKAHERRTGTRVEFSCEGNIDNGSLPSKIVAYRLIQEALNNSFRHAGGIGQHVNATCDEQTLCITIVDQGPGFDVMNKIDQDLHLGLSGIRERVNSLGGSVQIVSVLNQGTKIQAYIPLQVSDNPEVGL